MKSFFLYIFIFTFLIKSFSQEKEIKFRHITVDNGLSQSWIKCIYQDKYGYMWFGAGGSGINKYNGYDFKIYKNNPNERKSISNNQVTAIFEDKKGNLLIGTVFGLNIYNRDSDYISPLPFLSNKYINDLYETEDGKLYASTVSNIYEVNISDSYAIPYYNLNNGYMTNTVTKGIAEDIHGNIWLGSNDGLYQFNTHDKSFTVFKHIDKDQASIISNSIESIYKDSKGRIWIGTVDKGLCLMQFRNNSDQPYFINFMHNPSDPKSINKGSIRAMLDDGEGRLWIGIENGGVDILNLKNFENGYPSFVHNVNNLNDETTISNNSVYSLYKDIQGTIWVGTYEGGLNLYNELLFKFRHYKNTSENNIIYSICKKENELWLGTEGGLVIHNLFTNQNLTFKHNPSDKNTLGSNAVLAHFEDSRHINWFGTWAGGLNKFDNNKKNFSRYLNDSKNPNSIGGNNIFDIKEDNEGNLWIACMNGGLNKYDYKTNSFTQYRVDFLNEKSISGDWVVTMLINSYGDFWVATSVAVDLFNKKTGCFKHFNYNPEDPKSLSHNGATVIFEDKKRNTWFGTEGGLNSFVREDSSFVYYREIDGLPDNAIKGICEDDNGNLWLSTNKGISKFIKGTERPKHPQFENYTVKDGLQGNEFIQRSVFKDVNGYMYFGGINGISFFHPDSIKSNSYIPPVVLTDFLLFNKPVELEGNDSPLKKQISIADEIVLNYNQSIITFKFAALNYLMPEKNEYRYFLKGFDKDWHYVGNKREATTPISTPENIHFM